MRKNTTPSYNVAIEKKRMAGAHRCGRNDELSTKKVILNLKALSLKIKSKVVGGGGRGGCRTI